jgi:hypothetical protein
VKSDPSRRLHDENPEEFLRMIFANIKQKNSGPLNESQIETIANQLASYSGINLYRTMTEHSECVESYLGNSLSFSPERIAELDEGACLLNWVE